jgi:hypothetical protein
VKRIVVMALSVVLALVVAMPMALGQAGQGSKASGKASELAAAWTQWAFSKPVNEDSPLIGGDPHYRKARCDGTPLSHTPGNTWFLAGTFDQSKVVRTCTMPVGTKLFFPVVNWVAFPFFDGETAKSVRKEQAIAPMNATLKDPTFRMRVTVDGKKVASDQIVRAISRPYFSVTLPEKNVFDPFVNPNPPGVPAGKYKGWSTDGLWVTLHPLPPGEHTIHFKASARNVGVSQDNTYILTVGKR